MHPYTMGIRSLKYRIYPSKSQEKLLDSTVESCRFLYNNSLEHKHNFYKYTGKYLSYFDQIKELPEVKDLHPEYKKIHSQILQNVHDRLDKTYQSFFRRVKSGESPGFPKWKKKSRYKSFTYPQFKLDLLTRDQLLKKLHKKEKKNKSIQDPGNPNTQYIYLSKIGYVKINYHQEILGKVKTCTVTGIY